MTPLELVSKSLTPYWSTSYAVWSMMNKAGISDTKSLSTVGLADKLLNAADNSGADVLTQEPTVTPALTQNAEFTQAEDKKWYSSPIKLTADGISTRFTLTISDQSVQTTDGKTEVKAGESFTLVSDSKPNGDVTVTATSTVPWMDGDLIVYKPNGPSFQNMVGVRIKNKVLSASATIRTETTSISFTKKWVDKDNAAGKRPTATEYADYLTLKENGVELSNYDAKIDDNGDNTYTITYSGLPKTIEGRTAEYTVVEKEIDGYSSDAAEVKNGGTLTNTKTPDPSPAPSAAPSSSTSTAKSTAASGSTTASATTKPVPKTSANK